MPKSVPPVRIYGNRGKSVTADKEGELRVFV